mmetsp:Transcript_52/g.125  ORF Transcript_52/g.125 Transcript_52/m.125 type:complete len:204 (-) Transcript_52:20-631(-)
MHVAVAQLLEKLLVDPVLSLGLVYDLSQALVRRHILREQLEVIRGEVTVLLGNERKHEGSKGRRAVGLQEFAIEEVQRVPRDACRHHRYHVAVIVRLPSHYCSQDPGNIHASGVLGRGKLPQDRSYKLLVVLRRGPPTELLQSVKKLRVESRRPGRHLMKHVPYKSHAFSSRLLLHLCQNHQRIEDMLAPVGALLLQKSVDLF